MATWFTSDQHWDHRNIIEYCSRPFASLSHMVDGMVERHNSLVAPGDDVWHLGDFALDPRTALRVLPRLNGRHRLVSGNHDWTHPLRSEGKRRKGELMYSEAGFVSIHADVFLPVPEFGLVRMTHMPYDGDSRSGPDRHAEWRPTPMNEAVLLHGHVHERWQWRPEHRMLNVGVDVWDWRPVSLAQVLEVVRS